MPDVKEKPFPWKCGHCREKAVYRSTMEYRTEIAYDGRTYTVTVPDLEVPRCQKCGTLILDSPANRRIDDTFRQQLGLLQPEEIRRNRERLNLTQRELAARLGIAEATLSRWETGGQFQQRSLDRLLRLYFEMPEVRDALAAPAPGQFRCLEPTEIQELRRQARRFRLVPGKRPAAANGTEDLPKEPLPQNECQVAGG
jgi:putative zinc finger/helix-turn-helix YgiT family protein